jgi:putative photosynthetic complex assembly protein
MTMASAAIETRRFPRLPLFAAFVLIGFAFIATLFGQATEIGTVRVEQGQPREIRDIVILEDKDGVIAVSDHRLGTAIASFAPGEGGFVRGALRGLSRERMIHAIPPETAYRLILWDTDRLTLSDVGTGIRIDLLAFGPTNAGAFARFLDTGSDKK